MAKYLLAFHGGEMPSDQTAINAMMSKWGEWMDSLGSNIIDLGSIVGQNQFISAANLKSDPSQSPVSGYMIISGASIDAAVDVANGCPILDNGGSVQVAEFMSPPE